MKFWLAILGAASAGIIVAALFLADRPISPAQPHYHLKRMGELINVHFLTFDAPAKQARHLELAGRRREEFVSLRLQLDEGQRTRLYRRYQGELARAEFMAEQLALLDHQFIRAIEAVYLQTLAAYQTLHGLGNTAGIFRATALQYNQFAIKTLLHKHQHTPQLTARYRALISRQADWVEAQQANLSNQQREKLELAKKVLNEGKELEWAYDILVSISKEPL